MGVPTQPNSRLTELLDSVRTEFDSERSKVAEYEQNSKFAQMFYPVCSMLRYAPFRGFVSTIPLSTRGFPIIQARQLISERATIVQPNNMVFEKPDMLTSDVQSLVASQMQEMELVRQKVYALEQAQLNMKERYTAPFLSRRWS